MLPVLQGRHYHITLELWLGGGNGIRGTKVNNTALLSGFTLLRGKLEGFKLFPSLFSLGYLELCFKLSVCHILVSFQVLVKLEGGIGLSLINKVPEELVFASLTGINVHYTQLATSHMLELSIQDVQVRGKGV